MRVSFHSRFNESFYKGHPDLFVFIDTLIQFQIDNYVTIQSLDIVKTARSSYFANKAHIEKLIAEYNENNVSRLQYIKRTGYYLAPQDPSL